MKAIMESEQLEQSLTDTLRKSDLSSVATDAGELVIDSLLDEGVVKDIPAVGAIVSLWKTGANIRDHYFIKKLVLFLSELQKVDVSERNEMINRLEDDPKYGQKAGESLVLLLERLDDMQKPTLLGKAFKAYCKNEIDSVQLQSLYRVIDRSFIPHLTYLPEFINDPQAAGTPGEVLGTFVDSGLAWVPPNYATTTIMPTNIARLFNSILLEK